jgi:FkbM family methyltransferase
VVQLIYRLIYHPFINSILRGLTKPFKSSLSPKYRLPPSGSISFQVSEKKKVKLITNQTSYLTQLVYWNGYENFEYSKLFVNLIKEIDHFWDIGANIGYYSLIAAKVNPNIKVVAFEPAPEPLHFLKRNVSVNKLSNIRVESLALSDKNGELTFYEIKNQKYKYLKYNLAGEGNAGSKTTGRNFSKTTVQGIKADDYLIGSSIGNIDLIKIDTEGTEHLILQNAESILLGMKPIIICETLFNKIEKELNAVMIKHGYEFYNHTADGLQKVDSIEREIDNGVLNCFFVHPSKLHLIKPYLV